VAHSARQGVWWTEPRLSILDRETHDPSLTLLSHHQTRVVGVFFPSTHTALQPNTNGSGLSQSRTYHPPALPAPVSRVLALPLPSACAF
jgi:hypothetical protein